MPDDVDANETAEKAKIAKAIADSNKETLWWAIYRLLGAIHSARYAAKADDNKDQVAILHIIGFTADHWGPQIPGMPTLEEVWKDCHADDAHHERTRLGEQLGIYLTGDEFM